MPPPPRLPGPGGHPPQGPLPGCRPTPGASPGGIPAQRELALDASPPGRPPGDRCQAALPRGAGEPGGPGGGRGGGARGSMVAQSPYPGEPPPDTPDQGSYYPLPMDPSLPRYWANTVRIPGGPPGGPLGINPQGAVPREGRGGSRLRAPPRGMPATSPSGPALGPLGPPAHGPGELLSSPPGGRPSGARWPSRPSRGQSPLLPGSGPQGPRVASIRGPGGLQAPGAAQGGPPAGEGPVHSLAPPGPAPSPPGTTLLRPEGSHPSGPGAWAGGRGQVPGPPGLPPTGTPPRPPPRAGRHPGSGPGTGWPCGPGSGPGGRGPSVESLVAPGGRPPPCPCPGPTAPGVVRSGSGRARGGWQPAQGGPKWGQGGRGWTRGRTAPPGRPPGVNNHPASTRGGPWGVWPRTRPRGVPAPPRPGATRTATCPPGPAPSTRGPRVHGVRPRGGGLAPERAGGEGPSSVTLTTMYPPWPGPGPGRHPLLPPGPPMAPHPRVRPRGGASLGRVLEWAPPGSPPSGPLPGESPYLPRAVTGTRGGSPRGRAGGAPGREGTRTFLPYHPSPRYREHWLPWIPAPLGPARPSPPRPGPVAPMAAIPLGLGGTAGRRAQGGSPGRGHREPAPGVQGNAVLVLVVHGSRARAASPGPPGVLLCPRGATRAVRAGTGV